MRHSLPLPQQSGTEKISAGEALTRFIQRGMTSQPTTWISSMA
ncbi:MAG TPA: hypothetical protein VNK49_12675 [Anaerolineales bacterium]|nr:hypothetical protein [Anaerolineales bacterium]